MKKTLQPFLFNMNIGFHILLYVVLLSLYCSYVLQCIMFFSVFLCLCCLRVCGGVWPFRLPETAAT